MVDKPGSKYIRSPKEIETHHANLQSERRQSSHVPNTLDLQRRLKLTMGLKLSAALAFQIH